MPVEMSLHYVAFLDVLGFSEMVRADLSGNNNINLKKLYRCHQSAAVIFNDQPDCVVMQFSDSVVIAKPFQEGSFEIFVKGVAKYQRLLLDEELLCRGGIAVNKHFSNGTFTFSAGLIEAYAVESKAARHPRVVISSELMNLLFPNFERTSLSLVQEDDGLYFVDYLGLTKTVRPRKLLESVSNIVNRLGVSDNPSLREKGLWLAAYSDCTLGTNLQPPRFQGKRIKEQ